MSPAIVETDHLQRWVEDFGPALGLTLDAKGLPACWDQHPIAVHEITGLFLAWTALLQALTPAENPDPFSPTVIPGPRAYLDLSYASATAVARAIAAGATCARAGHHVGDLPGQS